MMICGYEWHSSCAADSITSEKSIAVTLLAPSSAHATFTRPTLLAYPAEKANDLRLASFIDWVIQHYDH